MTDPNTLRSHSAPAATDQAAIERITTFLTLTYGWMFGGLVVTGIVATFTAQSPALLGAIFG